VDGSKKRYGLSRGGSSVDIVNLRHCNNAFGEGDPCMTRATISHNTAPLYPKKKRNKPLQETPQRTTGSIPVPCIPHSTCIEETCLLSIYDAFERIIAPSKMLDCEDSL
jgi:hypothetical protein